MEMISFWIGTLNSIKRFQKQNKKHLEKKLTDSNGQDKTSFQELIHKKQDKLWTLSIQLGFGLKAFADILNVLELLLELS